MKKGIHPEYRPVIFEDVTSGARFLIGSTAKTKDKAVWEKDNKEYPLVTVEISSASHPVYTGLDIVVDTAGRVDKFKKRAEASKSLEGKKKAVKK